MKWMTLLLAAVLVVASCQKEEGSGYETEDLKKAKMEMKDVGKSGDGEEKKAVENEVKKEVGGESEAEKVLSQGEIQEIIDRVRDLPALPVEEDEVGVIETNLGTIVVQFFTDVAPRHSANFKKLANAGFYDGIKVHRVIPGFVIQAGCINTRDDNPGNDGTGGPGYTLKAEFNDRKHDRGILSMARSRNPDSGGSQFFICLTRAKTKSLDRNYTVFGEVIKGMDVVDKIVALPRGMRDRPNDPPVMKKVYMRKKKAGE